MKNQEEIRDRLGVMRSQEDSIYCCSDYLQSLPHSDSGTIDQLCRLKMAQWCFNVIDYIEFRRETVSIAMSYLDRFLCSGSPRAEQVINCRKEYQLASMATLFMAIKINEPVIVDVTMLADLSKGLYTPKDFRQMEIDVLFALNWRVNGPTAQSFVAHLLTLMQKQMPNRPVHDLQKILDQAMYQVELSAGDYELMTQKPSVIATASIRNCVEKTSPAISETFGLVLSELAASIDIRMEDLHSTKMRLRNLEKLSPMQMRPSLPTIMEIIPSPCSIASRKRSQDQHCSPICVSKRDLFQQ